jgi:hypothetical protein
VRAARTGDDGDPHSGHELRQHDRVSQLDDADVLHSLEQPCLVIEQQHHAVGRIDETLPPPVDSTLDGAGLD